MTYMLDQLFSQITERLSNSPGLHLHELAQELCVDRHTLLKAVKQAALTSFRNYQKSGRLEIATSLLTQRGDLSGKQVADRVGYQSADAFSRFIKREAGKTASTIRRDARRRHEFSKMQDNVPFCIMNSIPSETGYGIVSRRKSSAERSSIMSNPDKTVPATQVSDHLTLGAAKAAIEQAGAGPGPVNVGIHNIPGQPFRVINLGANRLAWGVGGGAASLGGATVLPEAKK